MTTTSSSEGRIGNQIIRNIAVSLIAEKNDLFVNYSSYNLISQLGIDLFIGKNRFLQTISLTDENYLSILQHQNQNQNKLNYNLNPNNSFFQTKEIIQMIYDYIHLDKNKTKIMENNPFKDRYNSNNDLFIHVRLTDVAKYNPGLNYYLHAISKIQFDNLYISSDNPNHSTVQAIKKSSSNSKILNYDEIRTFQFSSTCKHIILSHGTFSSIIGYLSFFSDIYYPKYGKNIWHGDIFSIEGWNEIDF